MAVARRAEFETLWDYRDRKYRLVQRIEHQAQHDRAVRPQDREISNLGDSFGWRSGAEHGAHPGRQPVDRVQRHEPHRPGPHKGRHQSFTKELSAGRTGSVPAARALHELLLSGEEAESPARLALYFVERRMLILQVTFAGRRDGHSLRMADFRSSPGR